MRRKATGRETETMGDAAGPGAGPGAGLGAGPGADPGAGPGLPLPGGRKRTERRETEGALTEQDESVVHYFFGIRQRTNVKNFFLSANYGTTVARLREPLLVEFWSYFPCAFTSYLFLARYHTYCTKSRCVV